MSNEELFAEYRNGNEEALGALYSQLEGFIRGIAAELTNDCDYLDDLCAIGALNFMSLIDRFEPERGAKKTTYLYKPIRFAMLRWLDEQYEYSNHKQSEENDFDLESSIPDTFFDSTDYAVLKQIRLEIMRRCFKELSAKDKFILGHFYGAYGYTKMALDEIAFSENMRLNGAEKAKKAALDRLWKLFYAEWHVWTEARKAIDRAKQSAAEHNTYTPPREPWFL